MSASEPPILSALASLPDAVICIDKAGIVTFFSRGAQKMFGHDPDDMLATNVSRILKAPYMVEQRLLVIPEVLVARKAMGRLIEVFGRHADGREFPIEMSVTQVDDNYTMIIRDTTERTQRIASLSSENEELNARVAELSAALRAANARLEEEYSRRIHTASSSSSMGTFALNFPFTRNDVHWAETTFALHGLDPDHGEIALESYFEEVVHQDDKTDVIRAFEDAVQDGREFDVRYRVVWPDGSVHALHTTAESVRDQDGRVVTLLGTMRAEG